ncbi:hypothetical protein ES703_86313 [subsurface metagenome]
MNKEGNGYKCPECGAAGKYHGEHVAAVRQVKGGRLTEVNVGWGCWSCGHEWGFEPLKEPMLIGEIKRG